MYEFQKVITSIVLVVLVVFGISKTSDIIFKTDKNVVAYKVDVVKKTIAEEDKEVFDLASFVSVSYTHLTLPTIYSV